MTAPPPPPARVGKRLVVPVDVLALRASVHFDLGSATAHARAEVDLVVDGPDGYPAFDLRQSLGRARLDGRDLAPDELAHEDVGAGWASRVRVLGRECGSGSRHRLELSYELGLPEAAGSQPLGWSKGGDGVNWDLWMSDLEPGRYLEMWFPAGFCHDRLAIDLEVEVGGTGRPHVLLANGTVEERRPGGRWRVRYPPAFTSLSPMLVVAPADELAVHEVAVRGAGQPCCLTLAAPEGAAADPLATAGDTSAWLAGFAQRYGTWSHGGRFLAVLWSSSRGMEYDGATTACEAALEHEVFHSWFGRGVKPASANDGWMDEAMATWATSSRRAPGRGAACEPLGLDEEPSLLCPPHPWSRFTPREAYPAGERLMAGLAAMAGGPASLRSALASWHDRFGGGPASTADLAGHLSTWCGRDLGPWWDRYVYGGEARP